MQNYNTYLRRLFLSKREDAEEDKVEFHFDCAALLDEDVDFQDLPLRDRVLILQQVWTGLKINLCYGKFLLRRL
jgi:hypothetical protein